MSANEELLSAAIRHAVHNARYGRGLAAKIVKLLNEADRDLLAKLAERLLLISQRGFDTGPATTARISEMIEAMRFVNDAVYREIAATLNSELVSFAELETAYQASTIERAVAIDYSAKVPTPTFLKTLVEQSPVDGHLLKSWLDEMPKRRLSRVEQQLRLGLVQGETIQQITARVRGVLPISRRSAETLAITSVSTVSNQARLAVYRENDDLIKGVTFTATLDTRTSSQCQSHDGEFYAIDKAHPKPPLHPRCRSVLVPVTKSWRELGIKREEATAGVRASLDGQVPASTTYGEWLKKQSRERQAEVLGEERAELFRSGKVAFADLYRDDGSYVSLEELKKRLRS